MSRKTSHKVNNIALTNLANKLRAESDKQEKSLKKHKDYVTQLQSEIAVYENLMKALEGNEAKLKTIINNQEKDYQRQQETFDQTGNPDYNSISKLEEVMMSKLEEVGTTLVSKVKTIIDEKLTAVNNKMVTINPCHENIEVGTSGSTFSKVLQLPTKVKQLCRMQKMRKRCKKKIRNGMLKTSLFMVLSK